MKSLLQIFKPRRSEELEFQLRSTAKIEAAPIDLHDSIMRAVKRQVASPGVSRPRRTILRWIYWIAAPASAICLAAGLLLAHQRPAPIDSTKVALALSAPATAFEFRENLAATMPSTLAPLSDELTAVQKDIDRTTDFLRATLP